MQIKSKYYSNGSSTISSMTQWLGLLKLIVTKHF